MNLHQKQNISPMRYLVFSSTGDHARASSWLGKNRDYDIWLTHYSSDSSPFEGEVEYLNYRAGGKLQNLHYAISQWPEIFKQYEYIWIADDDISLKPSQINKLFLLARNYQLDVSQPAFDVRGKISYNVTAERAFCSYRLTNFVETTCPVMNMPALLYFMTKFDTRMTGYGADWVLIHHLYNNSIRRYGIIDKIRCLNPHDSEKQGRREIDKLQSHKDRKAMYEKIKGELGMVLDEAGGKTIARYYDSNVILTAYRVVRRYFLDKLVNRYRRYSRIFKQGKAK